MARPRLFRDMLSANFVRAHEPIEHVPTNPVLEFAVDAALAADERGELRDDAEPVTVAAIALLGVFGALAAAPEPSAERNELVHRVVDTVVRGSTRERGPADHDRDVAHRPGGDHRHRGTRHCAHTMNRPDRLNALSMELVEQLHSAVAAADATHRSASSSSPAPAEDSVPAQTSRAVRIRETRACPSLPARFPFGSRQEFIASLHERIHRSRKPFIAALNGVAVGGGFSLALACDVRIASETASFGAVFIKLGISACDMGTSYFLPRLVGAARSAELLLTGRVFDAAEALDIGLVTKVVAPDVVVDSALETAREIAANSPLGVWMTKETMWQTIDGPSLRAALDIDNRTQIMCTAAGHFDWGNSESSRT